MIIILVMLIYLFISVNIWKLKPSNTRKTRKWIVYAILWPVLVLKGVGKAVATQILLKM